MRQVKILLSILMALGNLSKSFYLESVILLEKLFFFLSFQTMCPTFFIFLVSLLKFLFVFLKNLLFFGFLQRIFLIEFILTLNFHHFFLFLTILSQPNYLHYLRINFNNFYLKTQKQHRFYFFLYNDDGLFLEIPLFFIYYTRIQFLFVDSYC